MSNKFKEIVEETYIETLENLAFLFSNKVAEGKGRDMLDNSEFYLSEMKFSGGLEGCLKLATEKEVGNIIAENMLGGMEDECEDLCIDSLKEITNVICGKLVTEIAGTEPIIDLTIPEVKKINRGTVLKLIEEQNSIIFNSEEYLVVLVFKLTE